MKITDCSSFSYHGNQVMVNGISYEIGIPLDEKIMVVLYNGTDYPEITERLNDGTVRTVVDNKYQYAIDEWIEVKKSYTKKINNPLSDEEQISAIKKVINNYILSVVKKYNFSSTNSIGKYVGYDNAYRSRAESLGLWISEIWSFVDSKLLDYNNGNIVLPSLSSIVNSLPKYKG